MQERDPVIEKLFAGEETEVVDEGFVDAVMHRIRRPALFRTMLLAGVMLLVCLLLRLSLSVTVLVELWAAVRPIPNPEQLLQASLALLLALLLPGLTICLARD